MSDRMTLSQKIAAGFAMMVLFTIITAVVAIIALRQVANAQNAAAEEYATALVTAERVQGRTHQMIGGLRGYLFAQDPAMLQEMRTSAEAISEGVASLEANPALSGAFNDINATLQEYRTAANEIAAQSPADRELVLGRWQQELRPLSERLEAQLAQLRETAQVGLQDARQRAENATRTSVWLLVAIAIAAVLLSALLAWLLSRALTKQVGSAVAHLQTSSTQLQAASQQQATTAKEQATATTEVTTTVRELLASSRQIGESAQRVARAAEQTAGAAQSGDDALRKAHQQMAAIQKQVDRIVEHMLDLGRKSQQVGSILEIIDELAEQTNILAINATIESAGAGESGRRFAVVAEEIRRLADRVGSSTREIRTLVEEIRAAANTTAMATEEGSKTADAGARQFDEVTARFAEITDLVVTTTETAREIELGTRQQVTAVEQVNQAISNLSQSAREVETGSRETVSVASRLAELSRALMRLVRRQGPVEAA